MEDILKNLAIIATGGFVILVNYWRTKLEEKRSKDLNSGKSADLKINAMLAEIRVLFDANRAMLLQFHNGGKYFSGNSIRKMSLTNCQVSTGIEIPRIQDWQNIPTSFLTKFLDSTDPKKVYLARVVDLEDMYFQHLFLSQGSAQIMAIEIESMQNEILAVLLLSWMDEKIVTESDETLLEYAKKIGVELTFKIPSK